MNELATQEHAPEVIEHDPGRALTPMEMVGRAVSSGAGVEVIEKLMALQERWDANQARKAFDAAMASAKAELPVILKNREVDFTSAKGRTHYRHEDMAGIARQVDPILAKHGLSYRFRTTSLPNEPVTVTCIVSHRDGYSEENTLAAGKDESGNKNSIQAVGSTITYLQRYTLKAALGLAASDDDDGKAMTDGGPISEDQLKALRGRLDACGANIPAFCTAMRIKALAELPTSRYGAAIKAIEAKEQKIAKESAE